MNKAINFYLLVPGILLSFSAGSQQMVDPTQPQNFTPAASSNNDAANGTAAILVTAVFIHGERKTAVINGDTVSEGQNWQGNKVKKVHKGGVVLVKQGRETELFINQYSIKKDASNDF